MSLNQIFGDDSIVDNIFDIFDSTMPSFFALSVNFYNDYKYYIKLLIVLVFTTRVLYRLFYLNITKTTSDLRFKLISNIVNIIILIYCIYSESNEKVDEEKN